MNDTEVKNKKDVNIISKKKKIMEKLWTRSQAKQDELKNDTKRNIPMCRCKCNEKVTELEAEQVFRQFINLSSPEQNIYLKRCIKEEIVQRYRPRNGYSRPRRVFKYTLKLSTKSVKVCAKAFLAVHGIKCDRLKNTILQKQKNISIEKDVNNIDRKESRTKHDRPKNKMLQKQENISVQKDLNNIGRKERKIEKLLTRNEAKLARLKNHVRRNMPNCRCKCYEKVTELEAEQVFRQFINLSSHTEQNIYLQGCTKEEAVHRYRPRNLFCKARRVFVYTLKLPTKNVIVCANAFLAVHGIKRDRLKRKVLEKHKDISDGRGKRNNPLQKFSDESVNNDPTLIHALSAQISQHCRTVKKQLCS